MSRAPGAGTRPTGVSTASAVPSRRSMTHLRTRALSPKPGHRNEPSSSSRRNQLTWKILGSLDSSCLLADLEPVVDVVAGVVADERQHRHRVAAHDADRAGGGGGGLARTGWRRRRRRGPSRATRRPAARWSCGGRRRGSRRSGRRWARRTPGPSSGTAWRGCRTGCWGGWRARRTRGSSRGPSSRSGAPGACLVRPSHHTSPSSVRATLVNSELPCSTVRIALGLVFSPVPGATPNRPNSGLTAYRRPSGAEAHPGDVVADHLGGPALQGGVDHREVGLAAGAGEGAGDVVGAARPGRSSLRMSMCSAIQPSSRAIAEAIRSA